MEIQDSVGAYYYYYFLYLNRGLNYVFLFLFCCVLPFVCAVQCFAFHWLLKKFVRVLCSIEIKFYLICCAHYAPFIRHPCKVMQVHAKMQRQQTNDSKKINVKNNTATGTATATANRTIEGKCSNILKYLLNLIISD